MDHATYFLTFILFVFGIPDNGLFERIVRTKQVAKKDEKMYFGIGGNEIPRKRRNLVGKTAGNYEIFLPPISNEMRTSNKLLETSSAVSTKKNLRPKPDLTNSAYCVKCNIHFKYNKHYEHHYAAEHKGDKPYTCRYCDIEGFQHKYNLDKHVAKRHSQRKDYAPPKGRKYEIIRCPACETEIEGVSKFQKHARTYHPREKLFQCNECTDKFLSKKALNIHWEEKHSAVGFHCKFCRKMYYTSLAFDKHKKDCVKVFDANEESEEQPIPEFSTFCEICHLTSHKNDWYKQHCLKEHPHTKVRECDQCGKWFANRSTLAMHKTVVHGMENNRRPMIYKCDHCGEEFHGLKNFKEHGLKKHPGMKMFKCKKCSDDFTVKASLMRHMKAIHDIGDFLCNHCKQTYARADELKRHQKSCGKKMKTRSRITDKEREHFHCDICDKTLHVLRRTFKEHKNECKDYDKCAMCHRKFHKNNPEKLKNHVRIRHSAQMNVEALLQTINDYKTAAVKSEIFAGKNENGKLLGDVKGVVFPKQRKKPLSGVNIVKNEGVSSLVEIKTETKYYKNS